MGEIGAVDDDQHVGLGGDHRVGGLADAAQDGRQPRQDSDAKPMMARSPSGNRLGTPCAAICAPPTPLKAHAALALRGLQRGDQRGAQPVAGFLARHQKDMRARRARMQPASPLTLARRRHADDENAGAVGGRDQPLRLGNHGCAGDDRDAGKAGARPRARPFAARWSGRSKRRSWPGLGAFTSTPLPAGACRRPLRRNSRHPRQHLVGALRRLHRQHVPAADHHRLPDVERSGGAQIIEAERDIGAVALGRLRAGERARRRQDIGRHLMGAAQVEAALLDQPADAREQVVVAAAKGADNVRQRHAAL